MLMIYKKSDGNIIEKDIHVAGLNADFGIIDIVPPPNIDEITNMNELSGTGLETTLKTNITSIIDTKTDSLFLTETFSYGGIDFPIDKEDQFNYKAVVDEARAGFLEYPYIIKGVGSTYYNIQDLNDANTFYLSGMTVIQTILRTGWALKDSLGDMTIQQLLDFEDPRS